MTISHWLVATFLLFTLIDAGLLCVLIWFLETHRKLTASYSALASDLARLDASAEAFKRERDAAWADAKYWRVRAELYIDRAAPAAGISHEPVMSHAEGKPNVAALDPFGGAFMQSFDSTKEGQ